MKITCYIRLFIFCMICNFLKYKDFTVVDTKITAERYGYLDEGWLFIGRFKAGFILGMINKEVLAQFIYKQPKIN